VEEKATEGVGEVESDGTSLTFSDSSQSSGLITFFQLTLLATVGAAALAFTGIDKSFWLSRALFAAALGLSLCGILVVHYIGVLTEGVADPILLAALRARLKDPYSVHLLAYMMAAPAFWSVVHRLCSHRIACILLEI
jgi:hypothetical protein